MRRCDQEFTVMPTTAPNGALPNSSRSRLGNQGRQRGQALVMITLCSTLIFASAGLVVDIGWAYYRQQAARAAADAAAMAAARAALASSGGSFSCGGAIACQSATACSNPPTSPPVTDIDNACLYAQSLGFVASGKQSVKMAAGTGTPANVAGLTGASYWVRATISESLPQLFSAVLGNSYLTQGINSTAAVFVTVPGACIYALDPTANNAYVESGGSTLVTADCGVYVNSDASQAMVVSGGATLKTSPYSSYVVGKVSSDGNITPAPITGATAAANPFAGIPTPTISTPVTCTQTNYTLHGGSATISQGTYCGGITNSGGTLTFNPGLYILYGGGLTSSSSSGNLIGDGVTFYNTQGGSYSYKPITISGGGNATLSAQTSGPQAGMLFFEDPTITSSSKNTISGGSSTTLTGGLYFKNDNLVYSGGSSAAALGVTIVADTVEFSGSSKLSGYAGPGGGNVTLVALVQ